MSLVAFVLVGSIAPVVAAGRGPGRQWWSFRANRPHQLALALLASPHNRIVQVVLPVPKLPRRITCCCRWCQSGNTRLGQILFRILALLQQAQMRRCVSLLAGLWLAGLDALVLGLGNLGLAERLIRKLLPLNSQQFLTLGPHGLVEQGPGVVVHLEPARNLL